MTNMRGYKQIENMTVEDCRELLKNNVEPKFYSQVLKRIEELDNEAFNRCSTISACKDYIRLFPEGIHRARISEIIDDLYFNNSSLIFPVPKRPWQ